MSAPEYKDYGQALAEALRRLMADYAADGILPPPLPLVEYDAVTGQLKMHVPDRLPSVPAEILRAADSWAALQTSPDECPMCQQRTAISEKLYNAILAHAEACGVSHLVGHVLDRARATK